jgi:hypothetical protein
MAAHPTQPVLCQLGAGGSAWTWNYAARQVDVSKAGTDQAIRHVILHIALPLLATSSTTSLSLASC